jgi:YD repeat-containing protein
MRRVIFIWTAIAAFLWLCAVHSSTAGTVTISYTYDNAGRLIKADYGNKKTITYSYDDAGNILEHVYNAELALADAILALKILAMIEPSSNVYKDTDVSGDGRIGLEEVIFILEKVSGLR